ncbi:MAG TPA: hypothetical protein VGB97_02965 [Candidatus Paceibacterota bacterium]|jgi:hypothetical protein
MRRSLTFVVALMALAAPASLHAAPLPEERERVMMSTAASEFDLARLNRRPEFSLGRADDMPKEAGRLPIESGSHRFPDGTTFSVEGGFITPSRSNVASRRRHSTEPIEQGKEVTLGVLLRLVR